VCVCYEGRTMEFVFDQTQTPIIGSKYWDIATSPKLGVSEATAAGTDTANTTTPTANSGSASRTTTTTTTTGSENVSSWKRPASSQVS